MSKHWKRFAAVVVSLTMAFQFCVNDFYAYAETNAPEQETVEQTPPEQQTQPEPEVTTEPVETPAQTEPAQEPAPEVETEPTTPPEQEQPQQPVQEQTPGSGSGTGSEEDVVKASELIVKYEGINNSQFTIDVSAYNVNQTVDLNELFKQNGKEISVEGFTLTKIVNENNSSNNYDIKRPLVELTSTTTTIKLIYTKNKDSESGEEIQQSEESNKDSEDEDFDTQSKTENNVIVEKKTEEFANAAITMSRILQLYANETIEVSIEGVSNQTTVELPVGMIADNAPSFENYTYEYATIGIDGVEVVAVGVYEIGDTRYEYYSTDGESAQLIGDASVVLHYSQNALNIDYVVGPSEDMGTIIGLDSAREGEKVSFVVEPGLGYKTADVKVDEESIFVEGQEVYTFEMPGHASVVEVTFVRADSYTVTLNPLGNSADYDQHDYLGADCNTPSEVIVNNGSTLTTNVYTDATSDGRPLQYIIVNGQRIEINNNDNTSATVDGMDVTITKKWHRHSVLSWQYFEIIIPNVQKDINIDYFIKDERGIDDRTIQIDNLGEGIELYVKEENSDRLKKVSENDVYTISGFGTQIYFYAKSNSGYQVASIEGEGVNRFDNIYQSLDSPGAVEALVYGCQWELHFTRYAGDEANRTLSFEAVPIEYTVSYNSNGGDTTPIDEEKYSVAEGSNIITLASAPSNGEKVFLGWSIGEKTYSAGEKITVNDKFINEADTNNNFLFTAQWVEPTAVANYKVEYYRELQIGEYSQTPDLTKEFNNATVGDIAVANATPSELNIEGYVLDTDYEQFKPTGEVTDDDALVLKIFYALDSNGNGEPDKDESYRTVTETVNLIKTKATV